MDFEINWQPSVPDIKSLDPEIRNRIIQKIRSIQENPFRFVERLEGYPLFKLRIGDYRVILDIKPNENSIVVVLVGHRSKVYQSLHRRI